MAINDDQVEDLKQTTLMGNEDSVVESPSILPQTKQKLTIIPETDALHNAAVNLSKEYEAKLPMMDTQLLLVDGNKSRLVDMEDVESAIATKGTADQTAADTVHAVFENLYDQGFQRNHFTQAPTKVNFPKLLTHMRKKIALEEQELVKNVATLMKDPIDDAVAILTEVKDKYLPALHDCYGKLFNKAKHIGESLDKAQNTIVLINGDFIDLVKAPLNDDDGWNGIAAFDVIRKQSKEYFTNVKAKTHFMMIANERSLTDSNVREATLSYANSEVTLWNFVNYFNNPVVFQFTAAIGERIDVLVAGMEKEKLETTDIITSSFETVKEYVETHGVELKELSQYHIEIVAHVLKLVELNSIADHLFDFFETRL